MPKHILYTEIGAFIADIDRKGKPVDICHHCNRFMDYSPKIIENKSEWPFMIEKTVDLMGNILSIKQIPKRNIISYYVDTGEIAQIDFSVGNPDVEIGAVSVNDFTGMREQKDGTLRRYASIQIESLPSDINFTDYYVNQNALIRRTL